MPSIHQHQLHYSLVKDLEDTPALDMQNAGMDDLEGDTTQARKIYHIKNCGMVHIDSFNAHRFRIQNCGNQVPQVNC